MSRHEPFVVVILGCIIIACVAFLFVPRICACGGDAKPGATKATLSAIQTAISMFRQDTGRFPSTAEGVEALATQSPGINGWNGPYLRDLPIDGWTNPFVFTSPGTHGVDYDLSSLGADGLVSTKDDITNWDR